MNAYYRIRTACKIQLPCISHSWNDMPFKSRRSQYPFTTSISFFMHRMDFTHTFIILDVRIHGKTDRQSCPHYFLCSPFERLCCAHVDSTVQIQAVANIYLEITSPSAKENLLSTIFGAFRQHIFCFEYCIRHSKRFTFSLFFLSVHADGFLSSLLLLLRFISFRMVNGKKVSRPLSRSGGAKIVISNLFVAAFK